MEELGLYNNEETPVCFFRTTVKEPYKKCLLQITEKCNLGCKHCFISADCQGEQISYDKILNVIIPYFKENNVVKVTLTGGEPLVHKNIIDIINAFSMNNIAVTVCSNGSLIHEDFVDKLQCLSNVKFNISLDGFSNQSHNTFRNGNIPNLFDRVINNIKLLSEMNLLKGILVTPNKYSSIDEYEQLCIFAKSIGAKYVLMNPLSQYGRGEEAQNLAMNIIELNELKQRTMKCIDEKFDIVYIRFPNEGKKLSKCMYGSILYVFTNGNIGICPYMVFAANNAISKYKPEDFYIGNIFSNPDSIKNLLSNYRLPQKENQEIECNLKCSRGCIAAKLSNGLYIEDCDMELCPLS